MTELVYWVVSDSVFSKLHHFRKKRGVWVFYIQALKTVCVKNSLSKSSRANSILGYCGLRPSAIASKTETTKIEKRKLNIAMETLNKVSAEFPETNQLIEEKSRT